MASFMIGVIFLAVSMFSEKAESAGFNTPPPPGHSLLKDYFGVNLSLLPPHDGGLYYSFNLSSFQPTKHVSTATYEVMDWYGNWNFNNWKTTTIWGEEPSGGEWYDVEAMYLDNDENNIYVAIVTSCPFYYDWSNEIPGAPSGVGIYEPRYSGLSVNPWIIPGDICINLSKNPRNERGSSWTSYDFGIDIIHEQRNPKDPYSVGIWHDPRQHTIQFMRDNNVGYELYNTTADPGGEDIGDPYLDLPGNPHYDWYTANVHEESSWEHTNFDPFSSWGTMPSPITDPGDPTKEVEVYYYRYIFDPHDPSKRENNAETYIIEVTIPISLLNAGGANIKPGDIIGIQWITGCRNEGVKAASVSHVVKGTIGDFVWNDLNGNGCQDSGEPGINDVIVNLRYASNNTLVATTLTGPSGGFASDGEYHFYVSPGDYYVEVIKPSGWTFTQKDICNDAIDSDANLNGKTDTFTLHPGESIDTIDIGLYMERAEIGDFVWNDLNGNGLQDSGEAGMAGIEVKLYGTGGFIKNTTTDGNGNYLFNDILPGQYYLVFSKPEGYFFSPKNAGNYMEDSDVDTNGKTDWIIIESGDYNMTIDAGIVISPETMKIFIGTIYYDNQLVHYLEVDDNEYDEHITNDTIIYLNYTNPSLLDKTYYRIWKWNYSSNDWMLLFDWITTEEGRQEGFYPINLCNIGKHFNLSCCGLYQIEYYSRDIYGNNESIKWNDVCVDCNPPTSQKEYGFPNLIQYIDGEPIHWITSDTLIYINASDGSCGSGVKEIWYQYLYPNGTLYPGPTTNDWALYDGPFNINGEDGIYLIYYYAVDNVGHVEAINKQKFILDNTPPLGEGTILWVDPFSQNVEKSFSSSFNINITSIVPIKGIECSIKFNPSLIKIDEVEGMFPVSYNGSIDNKNGTVKEIFGAYTTGNISNGIFAKIHFTTNETNIGRCAIELINVTILDENENVVPVIIWNGTIYVVGLPSVCRYDLNNDGIVNLMDLIMVAQHFGEHGYPGWIKEDISGVEGIPDGEINIFDMIAIANHWGYCP